MENKRNAEPNPKAIRILTYIIPIVLIGLILVLKNINTAKKRNFILYRCCRCGSLSGFQFDQKQKKPQEELNVRGANY
nr:hypothetical protein [Bacillus velezensis]MDH3099558.1 hypothetical protein [Bacillus velezensis]